MKSIKTVLQLLFVPWLMLGATTIQAETGLNHFDNMTKSITSVEPEKGLITIAEKTFKFDGKTYLFATSSRYVA